MSARTRPRPTTAPEASAVDEEELDPRVQRFLRFMAECAVRSMIREQEQADAPSAPDGRELALPSRRKDK